ncbi:acetyltransferase [Fusobacterium polymorphum]|jgi:sugar O-acyltransferase, sialic acid O-acetyltransferase neuD family|uniref:acetyltransferase n=1 Tax=Fusobacterium nucleatum subsp. polymorphum TaxID=76857 RepID=UPI0030D18165
MKKIVIIGASGFAREVAWLIEEINSYKLEWEILGFVDDNLKNLPEYINGYKVLGDISYINQLSDETFFIIGIGNSKIREQIAKKIGNRKFAILIHPNIKISSTNHIEEGTIICSGSILTVNINIKKHCIINLDCTIGHSAILEEYITVLPSTNISGNVNIKRCTTLGTGVKIIQGITIGENVMIGAGAVIIRDIEDNCTVVGNPGKIIKKGDKSV